MFLEMKNLAILFFTLFLTVGDMYAEKNIPFGVEFQGSQNPIPVKAVIVTMFEIGAIGTTYGTVHSTTVTYRRLVCTCSVYGVGYMHK